MVSKNKILEHRFSPVLLLGIVLIIISFLTRLVLLLFSFREAEIEISDTVYVFVVGLFFDVVNTGYFIIPLVFYLWLIPQKLYKKSWHRFAMYGLFFLLTLLLVLNAAAEFLFWNEFNTRFNFIAVDYLVYTTEVIGNIWESYPIVWIFIALGGVTLIVVYKIRSLLKFSALSTVSFRQRSLWAIALLLLPVVFYFTVNSKAHRFSKNMYVNELSGNGMYELFAAYLNNELDYNQFYKTINDEASLQSIRALLQTKESRFLSDDPFDLEREIIHTGEERKLNVVMISVESLSAEFLGAFGNNRHLTPALDSLAARSLLFTNVYATGTRTVRGLEALSLCIPPTPGQSIVRRPNNEHLYSLGKVFTDKGYECKYVFGGNSYFDNMGYFFANNYYEVDDRDLLKDEEIDYENIWGVADENLFTLASREIEKTLEKGKPIFAHIMTTSNHRPYTYPEGRIDIPSHTGREGAVKYTDYALGKFLKEASKKSWFNNTVFVIVADHCASSAGKTELPVNKYHIPLLIYSPANVPAQRVDRLMSQIDLGPTLLGLLNFSYTSKFFGYDIFQLEKGRERAFISTYQTLGFIKGNRLVLLSPQRKVAQVVPDFKDGSAVPSEVENELVEEAIAWYQASIYAFRNGLYKTESPTLVNTALKHDYR
jgi:phosphoglycerol transferase MdoB-like AlkP superfamily enzyme